MEVFENNPPPQIHTIQINERSYGQVFYFFAYIKSLTSYLSESRLLKANMCHFASCLVTHKEDSPQCS